MKLDLNINWERDGLINITMLVNGSVVTDETEVPGGITLRSSELIEFVRRVSPDNISIDRENVNRELVELFEGLVLEGIRSETVRFAATIKIV